MGRRRVTDAEDEEHQQRNDRADRDDTNSNCRIERSIENTPTTKPCTTPEPCTHGYRNPGTGCRSTNDGHHDLEHPEGGNRGPTGTSPSQQRCGASMVGAPAKSGKDGYAEEQHEQRPDGHCQAIVGDSRAAADREQLVLGPSGMQCWQIGFAAQRSDCPQNRVDVGASQLPSNDGYLPCVCAPEQLVARQTGRLGDAIGEHDQLALVGFQFTAQQQVVRCNRSAHDHQAERRVSRKLSNRLRLDNRRDDCHHLAEFAVTPRRPVAVEQLR